MNASRFRAAALAVVLCVGCATVPLTAGDTCGQRGMELAGVSFTEGRIGVSPTHDFDVEAQSVQCTPPPERNAERYCSVEAYRTRADFKRKNEWFFEGTRDKLLKRADNIWEGAFKMCMKDVAGR